MFGSMYSRRVVCHLLFIAITSFQTANRMKEDDASRNYVNPNNSGSGSTPVVSLAGIVINHPECFGIGTLQSCLDLIHQQPITYHCLLMR